MREIVKFTGETGLEVSFTVDDVRNLICPNATDQDLALFMELCASQKLNPLIGDAYLVKYGDRPAQMTTGKAVFLKRANANPNYKGFKAGVVYMDGQGRVIKREGGAIYKQAGEMLLGGWCEVLMKDRQPVYNEVQLDEYSTGQSLWKEASNGGKPSTMIRKVALVQSLREAMPTDFQGMYSEEEVSAQEMQDMQQGAETVQAEIIEQTPIDNGVAASKAQMEQMQKLIIDLTGYKNVDSTTVEDQLYKCRAMVNAGAEYGQPLTETQARTAIDQLTIWLDKAIADAKE